MTKRIRLLLILSLVASAWSLVTAGPAEACFNPEEPTCQIARAVCDATDPANKYRDKVLTCW